MSAQRLVSYVEDYQGNYWRSSRHAGHRVLTHTCADCGCLWGVTIQRDVLGQWYARHENSDYSPSLRMGPSTVTSPRFWDWQDAARWAADRGLLGGGE